MDNCNNCTFWKCKNNGSDYTFSVDDISITTRKGICHNAAMNDSVNLYVDNSEYQLAHMEFDIEYWPESLDGDKKGTPLELFRWETSEDFCCLFHEELK